MLSSLLGPSLRPAPPSGWGRRCCRCSVRGAPDLSAGRRGGGGVVAAACRRWEERRGRGVGGRRRAPPRRPSAGAALAAALCRRVSKQEFGNNKRG
uniref:Uncharacterized protein n=1 Tax=Oryza glaberrima TaxID=4538 RepID=I1P004_ORYGL